MVPDRSPAEIACLGMGANVGRYLAVLTSSNVRGMLKRRARQLESACVQHVAPPCEQSTRELCRHLERWEDDGGRAR